MPGHFGHIRHTQINLARVERWIQSKNLIYGRGAVAGPDNGTSREEEGLNHG